MVVAAGCGENQLWTDEPGKVTAGAVRRAARQYQVCIVERWRLALADVPGGRFVARAMLPRSGSGIALRISLAGTAAFWIVALA